jgi:hypothetical protein
VAQAALVGWARAQRLISPSVFEGQLTVRDANVAYLRVAAAFDERRETWVEEYPGPLPGQPETYDGSLKHARLSIDYGDRRWQNISDWHGVRRGVRKQDCFSCAEGWVKCQACNGSGKIVVQPTGACPYCSGQGFPVTEAVTPRGEVVYRPYRCPNCEGTGMAGPVRWPCQNGCSEGWFVCPRCQGHSYYLPSFYWGQLWRHMVKFGIWIPDNRDLRRFTKQYKLVRQTIGWPDLSDLPQDVQRAMNRRLEERLIRIRNQTLGQSSVVYHLETQLFLLPAVQVPYDHESKRAYLIGRHWEVYAPDEGRPGVRVTRAWVSARKALHAWLDRSSSSAQRPWSILAVILGIIVTFVVVLFMMRLIIGR